MNSEFGLQLKSLRQIKGLSQKEFAIQLGVGQSTIANYEKGIRVPDAQMLSQIANQFNVTIDYLLCKDQYLYSDSIKEQTDIIDSLDENCSLFLQFLLNNDKNKARILIFTLYDRGFSLEDIYFRVLGNALKEVGNCWELGKVDIWKEHYITEVILDIMRELKVKFKRLQPNNYTILSLTPGSELHNIGLKMLSDLLEIDGWNVSYIGSNVPVNSVLQAIEMVKPHILAISVTMPYHIDSACHTITAIKSNPGKKLPQIIIGGNAFINCNDVCNETGADFYNVNVSDYIKIASNENL